MTLNDDNDDSSQEYHCLYNYDQQACTMIQKLHQLQTNNIIARNRFPISINTERGNDTRVHFEARSVCQQLLMIDMLFFKVGLHDSGNLPFGDVSNKRHSVHNVDNIRTVYNVRSDIAYSIQPLRDSIHLFVGQINHTHNRFHQQLLTFLAQNSYTCK